MYSQPSLKSLKIFYSSNDDLAFKSFMDNLILAKQSFHYDIEKPTDIRIVGNQYSNWEKAIIQNLDIEKDTVIVLIIPGQRGKGPLYSSLKKLLITKFPIPSQIILSGTITRGKNLRSIVNKILIQICTKVGGEPWAIDNLPCTNKPTMLCGVETLEKKFGNERKQLIGFTATYNKTFTKYFSLSRFNQKDALKECIDKALDYFKQRNGIFPKHVIVMRDGVTPSRFAAVAESEVTQIKSEIDLKCEDTKLTYILLNKKTNVKIFGINNKSYINSSPGTIVDIDLSSEEKFDFYLISQKPTQGIAAPIYYLIAYDDKGLLASEVQLLIYRLCYLYYNFVGGIKVPAPCQYAHKLAYLVGDKLANGNDIPEADNKFNTMGKGLYYL